MLCTPAQADRRIALVVGNGAYAHATRLNNPVNDARDLRERLERLGFEVVQALDVGSEAFDAAISEFSKKLPGSDLALFFYAGHALQFNGVNFLLPVDTRIEGEYALRRKAVLAQEIIDQMERSAKVSLVFLDACRNNTLLRDLQQSLPEQTRSAAGQRGLARMDPRGTNTLIAFATSPNEVAADGAGRNSPFTAALLRHVETPNISVQDMLTSVAGDVLRETNSSQRPEVLSRLATRVVLHEKIMSPPPASPVPATPPLVSKEREASVAWEAVKDSCDRDRLAVFRERYADTFFGDLAKRRTDGIVSNTLCVATAEPLRTVVPPQPPSLPKRDIDNEAFVRALQAELRRVGCLGTSADGKWGETSRTALRNFSRRASKNLDDDAPSQRDLEFLSATTSRVCPLVCPSGQVARGEECVVEKKPVDPKVVPKATAEPKLTPPKEPSTGTKAASECYQNHSFGFTCSQSETGCKMAAGGLDRCAAAYKECMNTGRWVYRRVGGGCIDYGSRQKS